MVKGLQAGFGAPLGAGLLWDLRARGVEMIRADLQGVDDQATAHDLIGEIQDAGLQPLLIITPGQAPWLADEAALDVEVLNEPDLHGWSPQDYRKTVLDVHACLWGQHRIWAGCVSNCTKRKLIWLLQATQGLPDDIAISVHRYPKNGATPSAPQEGFRTREDEMAFLLRVVGPRRFGCSEWGYHTGEQKSGRWFWTKRWHWTDGEVAQFAADEWEWWTKVGATFSTIYQVNDGPTDAPIDRYGIRRTDGTWKPVADTFGP